MPLQKLGCVKALVASSALLFSSLTLAYDWQLDKDENGIQLYTKESQSAPLKQVKVVTSVKASLSSLVSFLSDHSAFPDWMDKVSKVEKLKDISEQESITYTVVDAPWPERDRDAVLYSKWEQNPETLVVTKKVYSEPQYLNADSSMIRSPYLEAEWVLTPRGNGMVEVAYVSDYDPGGDVQGWLLDMFTYEMPYNTMKNLRASALGKYEGAKFAFIKEPVSDGVAMTQ
ncbi:MAG: START domain-containing protein [Pseudomonadota bacterium]|nr:START domain-containing protein [Pseudomonadota bacterium]